MENIVTEKKEHPQLTNDTGTLNQSVTTRQYNISFRISENSTFRERGERERERGRKKEREIMIENRREEREIEVGVNKETETVSTELFVTHC